MAGGQAGVYVNEQVDRMYTQMKHTIKVRTDLSDADAAIAAFWVISTWFQEALTSCDKQAKSELGKDTNGGGARGRKKNQVSSTRIPGRGPWMGITLLGSTPRKALHGYSTKEKGAEALETASRDGESSLVVS
jgi:hypothetical protein